MEKPRVHFLDLFRGISLLNMLAYHLLFDLVFLFGLNIPWYLGKGAYWWQQMICGSFILFAGFSGRLSRNNGKRGALLLGLGMVLTIGTWIAMPEQLVAFGILHFMGCACLLLWLFRPLLNKVNPVVGTILSLGMFLLFRGTSRGYLGLIGAPVVNLPQSFYQTSFLFPLGFPSAQFFSSDYFPLLPWFFLFLLGFYLWPLLIRIPGLTKIDSKIPDNPVSWIGRHTLWIYMIHQPILYGACLVLHYLGVI